MRARLLGSGALLPVLMALGAWAAHTSATAASPGPTSIPALTTVPQLPRGPTTAPPPPTTVPPTSTSVAHLPPPAGSNCAPERFVLRPGTVVPVQYLSAVQFFNDDDGVGITSSEIPCWIGPGGASDEPFPVWEVVSHDGGLTWRTTGSPLPKVVAPHLTNATGFVVGYSTAEKGWVSAGGALAYTGDGGLSWKVLKGAGEALDLVPASGGSADALAARPSTGRAEVLVLSPSGSVAEHTRPVTVPLSLVQSGAQLAAGPDGVLFVSWGNSDRVMTLRTITGTWSWTTPACPLSMPGPSSEPEPYSGGDSLLVTGARALTAICGYAVGMDHEGKLVRSSADGGRSWRTVASYSAWSIPDKSGLPGQDLMAVATGPAGALYMATSNELAISRDGGRDWSPLDLAGSAKLLAAGPYGYDFSFVDARHGWVLLVCDALLRTVNGRLWSSV